MTRNMHIVKWLLMLMLLVLFIVNCYFPLFVVVYHSNKKISFQDNKKFYIACFWTVHKLLNGDC